METQLHRNLGLDLVRATEAAAIQAGRWMGLDKPDEADRDASQAMARVLHALEIDGTIIVGEEKKVGHPSNLDSGESIGTGRGPAMDVVVDAIDGTMLLARGHPDAISVAGAAPRGSMWRPYPAVYMEKIVVDREVAQSLVPECLDAPAAWTLALIGRMKDKAIRDLVVFILDRPRHRHLIDEIRGAGARVLVREEGDIAGALMAASVKVNVDVLMGIGGVSEGTIAACAIKSLGGAMLGRLAPQSEEERQAIQKAGLDARRILSAEELVAGEQVFFAATGITDGVLLSGVRYRKDQAQTESMVLRCETGSHRIIVANQKVSQGIS